jgi:hypothetical protein
MLLEDFSIEALVYAQIVDDSFCDSPPEGEELKKWYLFTMQKVQLRNLSWAL